MDSTSKLSPGVFRSRAKRFSRPILIRAIYKSRLEDSIAADLEERGVPFEYEKVNLKYLVPAKEHTYTPDFEIKVNGVFIESKGWLKAEDRAKMILVKASNPDLDIRFVFQKDATKQFIYKGSPTSYAKWCDDHGFPWADRGRVPDAWLEPKDI